MGIDVDLFRPFMARDAIAHVGKVLSPDEHGRIYCGEGPVAAEFEQKFARLVSQADNPPLLLNSCTSALELALYLCGVRPGTEVISTPMTCTATNGAILRLGGKIVWADVDPTTGLIDPEDVEAKLNGYAKAIMAVDWAGRSCDYTALKKLGVPVIQDAAHNLMVNPRCHGDYVCWSFQAIKHLTTGDGGALLVPKEQRERARLLRWYGLDRNSSADFRCAQDIEEAGFKMHMNDIAAAIGIANLSHASWVVSKQRNNAEWYGRVLLGIKGVVLPPSDATSSWWLYTVLVDDQQAFIAHMAELGIAASLVHRRNDVHPAFHFPNGPLYGVDLFASREVAIPVGWWLTERERERVASAVWAWASARVAVAA